MSWLNRIGWLFGRKQFKAEMEEELDFHIDLVTRELVEHGIAPEEARRQARIRFGSRDGVEERTHAVVIFGIENVWQDLRFAARMLRKNRVLTTVVILSMALGIGANVSIFTVVNAVMLRLLPVREPEHLMLITSAVKTNFFPETYMHDYEGNTFVDGNTGMRIGYSISTPTFEYLKAQNTVFEQTFGFASNDSAVNVGLGPNGVSGRLQAVSGNFFEGVGLVPLAGRILSSHDDDANAPATAVVAYKFWTNQLGADLSAVGRIITINETKVQIVGIAPPDFFGLDPSVAPDFWVPLSLYRAQWARSASAEELLDDRFTWWLTAVGRLKPGVTRNQASSELAVLFARSIGATSGQADPSVPSLRLMEAARGLNQLREKFSTSLGLLMGMVAVVLLIACANVAALLLARSSARRREVATRLSLGAPRRRVIRQLMTESILLSLLGGCVGLVISPWITRYLVTLLDVELPVHIDPHVLGFAVVVSVVCGILFGWMPALHATRVSISAEMKLQNSTASVAGRHRFRMGKTLVVSQVALSVLLLMTSGLLVRTLRALRSADLGFRKDHVATFVVRPGSNGYKDAAVLEYYRQLHRTIASLPEVKSATYAQFGPINEGSSTSLVHIPGYTTMENRAEFSRSIVGANYFETLGIPAVLGRLLGAQDTATSRHVILINEAFVRKYLRGNNPVGMEFTLGDRRHPNPCAVVGVVRDVKYSQVRDVVPPTIYFPFDQMPYVPGQASYMVHVEVEPGALFHEINAAALALNPNVPVVRFRSEESVVQQNLFMEQTFATLSTAFAAIGLLLACIGLYGTVAYTVVQRTSEIGVRIALGAARTNIVHMIVSETLRVVAIGITVGVPSAMVFTHLLKSQLYELSPHDSVTMIGAVAVLLAVTFTAGLIPAKRAASIDPAVALRHD